MGLQLWVIFVGKVLIEECHSVTEDADSLQWIRVNGQGEIAPEGLESLFLGTFLQKKMRFPNETTAQQE